MLDQDDVIGTVQLTPESSKDVIPQRDLVHHGASFRAEFADAGVVQRGGWTKRRGVRHVLGFPTWTVTCFTQSR